MSATCRRRWRCGSCRSSIPIQKWPRSDDQPYDWSATEISDALLKQSARLAPEAVPAEREYTQLHSFKYRADVGAYLYVQVAKDIKSFGGYLLGKTDARVLQVPPYPSELKILSQGALLALSGEKKVAVLVRDLPGVKVEIGRVLPSQLQHLVSQASGNFANPEFYDRFGPDNLVERFERKVPLPNLERGRAHYEAVDMGEYLKGEGAERRGVFLLTVSGYDPKAEERAAKNALAAQRRPGEAPPAERRMPKAKATAMANDAQATVAPTRSTSGWCWSPTLASWSRNRATARRTSTSSRSTPASRSTAPASKLSASTARCCSPRPPTPAATRTSPRSPAWRANARR